MPSSNGILPHNDNLYKPVPTKPDNGLVLTEMAEDEEEQEKNDISPFPGVPEQTESDCSSPGDPEIVVPPDGGWGWVVVAASFACNMVVDGIIFSFGTFLPYIQQSFGASKAHVALIGSLMSGFYLMAGPFGSAIANRYGFRIVAISGSILGAIAFVLSYFANSVQYLCISYGLIGGKISVKDDDEILLNLAMLHAEIPNQFREEKHRDSLKGHKLNFVMMPNYQQIV